MKRGDRVCLKTSGEVFVYAGKDGSCAKMMRAGDPVPHPVRIWSLHHNFEHEDGSPIADDWYKSTDEWAV